MTTQTDTTRFTSADGHCVLTHEPHADLRWQIKHTLPGGADCDWTASATQATPVHLVGQFFAHLASTAPVERTFQDLPALVQTHPGALITPVAGAAVTPHTRHAVAQAAQTPTARTRR